jgi:hypothetical protein
VGAHGRPTRLLLSGVARLVADCAPKVVADCAPKVVAECAPKVVADYEVGLVTDCATKLATGCAPELATACAPIGTVTRQHPVMRCLKAHDWCWTSVLDIDDSSHNGEKSAQSWTRG